MPLFSKEDRNEIKKSVVYRDFVMEQTFDLVTHFYPDQWLTLTVKSHDVVNILNCDYERADELLAKIHRKFKIKLPDPVKVSEFCEHHDIDDMLVQLFLASLKTAVPPPPLQIIAADCTHKPLRTINEVKNDLKKGIIIHMPAALYNELNPHGEPMYKRVGFYRVIVRPYEIAQIYECHIGTAREMLRKVRAEEGLPARAHVSIEKFCKVHYIDEGDFRKSLASIHGDGEEED